MCLYGGKKGHDVIVIPDKRLWGFPVRRIIQLLIDSSQSRLRMHWETSIILKLPA